MIFLGGVQRLAAVTEKIVPIMAAIFLLGGLVILIFRIRYVPATFGMIFKYAFEPQAIVGGCFRLRHQAGHQLRAPSVACSPTRPVWAPPPMPTLRPT